MQLRVAITLFVWVTLRVGVSAQTFLDTDTDGMPDEWEIRYDLDPSSTNDADEDPDGDWLANLAEYRNGCCPTNSDTDGDTLTDGWEVQYGLDPNQPHTNVNRLTLVGEC